MLKYKHAYIYLKTYFTYSFSYDYTQVRTNFNTHVWNKMSATSFLQKFDFLKVGDNWENREKRLKCLNELSRPCLQYHEKICPPKRMSLSPSTILKIYMLPSF